MRKIIIPAVIATSQKELNAILDKIQNHASLLQLDIMDGKFVPSHSLDFDFKLPEEKYTYEAHLMIVNPEEWIRKYGKKVDMIIAHIESSKNPEILIKTVKNMEKKMAFALNPETKIDTVKNYLDEIDQILIMTVNPGFYGSPFLPEMLEKIKMLRKLSPELDIEVDGGIKPDTIERVHEAGANMFVSGSYLIKAKNLKENMNILKNKINTR